MSLPPDPRLKNPSTYNREQIVAAVTDFYQFLTTLPYVEPDDILCPPPEGWPQITKDKFAFLNKTDEVIELLRHLPYLDSSRGEWIVFPWTNSCDYLQGDVKAYIPFPPEDDYEFPPWVINLTYDKGKYGKHLMLDTTDGTATVYEICSSYFDPVYALDDPRSWRDMCDDRVMPLAEYLDEWKKYFIDLDWIPPVKRLETWPHLHTRMMDNDPNSTANQMREIYLSHGWPESFRREECQKALEEWYRGLRN